MSRLATAGLDEPGFVGGHDGLYAVAQSEFVQDARHVRLDGGRAEGQLVCDLGVLEPACEQLQDLKLARGQLRQGVRAAARRRALGELLD